MQSSRLFVVFAILSLVFGMGNSAFADEDHAYLDAPRAFHEHPVSMPLHERHLAPRAAARKVVVEEMIALQTSVKAQQSRGTCSIFSAIGLFESMLVIKQGFPTTTDLSEEYLEYVLMRNRSSDGSYSTSNFRAIANFGMPTEATFPYIGQTWTADAMTDLAQQRCGRFSDLRLASCLLGHRDPELIDVSDEELLNPESANHDLEFQAARTEALQLRAQSIQLENTRMSVSAIEDIKILLSTGTPLTLDIDFYYGAWNHRKGPELGINRDMDNWAKGIVGYPESNSADRANSSRSPAGHSIVLVGYDDDRVVTTTVLMRNGSTRQFSYKGVYYFKNSWGADNFGVATEINRKVYPGYGMITQKYAHEMGTFTQMPLKGRE